MVSSDIVRGIIIDKPTSILCSNFASTISNHGIVDKLGYYLTLWPKALRSSQLNVGNRC